MKIRRYQQADEQSLFEFLKQAGYDYEMSWQDAGKAKYAQALQNSITYVVFDDEMLCGYARCKDDEGFGFYIYDLIIETSPKSRQLTKALISQIQQDFAKQAIYILSDADDYYEGLGCIKVGSIFQAN